LTIFNVFFDALVDQDVCEVVVCGNVKVLSCSEGVCKALIVVAKVKVEFGKKEGDKFVVFELIVLQKFFDSVDIVSDIGPVKIDVGKKFFDTYLLDVIVVIL
jgi:hypothetical protein